MIFDEKQKTQPITKSQVWEAFNKVKAKGGASGVDGLTPKMVAGNPKKYLYPLWNRMASGSYFPQPVKRVMIPKYDGSRRPLGIPTVIDRVAQTVIKEELEAIVEPLFSEYSYGYRPGKGAHQAIQQCRDNSMRFNWAIDLDIKGFFDNIDHGLMIKALKYFTECKHILLYVKRWLKASIQLQDEQIIQNHEKGTPQGGVISPILANIFLHVVFDKWFERNYPDCKFERYADDIIIHANRYGRAKQVLQKVKNRLSKCKLEVHPDKTRIVYCKGVQTHHPPFKPDHVSFDFLGFTFKPKLIRSKTKGMILCFLPTMSKKCKKQFTTTVRQLKLHRMTHLTIDQIAGILADKLRGWINYFGKINMKGLKSVMYWLNQRLCSWVKNKYKRFRTKTQAYNWLKDTARQYPTLFVHWQYDFRME
ncbi:MAG: group II intron reverse transcriptase/maturase [Bacteroidota bacterium]